MRILLAGLICSIAIPAAVDAATVSPKAQCHNTCKSSYTLCMKRANTGVTRKACKKQNKTCKKGCRG
jgi:hypothetical protein